MKFLLLAALPALVVAQYGPPAGPAAPASSSTSSSAAAAPTPPGIVITVGANNAVAFNPQAVNASMGQQVSFMFNEAEGVVQHSVTQSTFAAPCTPAVGGFASGLQLSGATWTLNITDSAKPIWFFCTQTTPLKHCNLGMVGAINAPLSGPNVLANFVAAASTASDSPSNVSGILTGLGAVATGPAGVPSTTAAAPATTSSSSAGKLIASAGSLLAGVFTLVYTLA